MKSYEADEVAGAVSGYLAAGDAAGAFDELKPVLEQGTPFRLLDRIAAAVDQPPWSETSNLLNLIAADGSEGGWVLIGGFLRQAYVRRPSTVMSECRRTIIIADRWYGADILGERVPGPALVDDFAQALDSLAPWRGDGNRWVRRSVGVAVHFWAKRSRGDSTLEGQAQKLLDFLEPMFEEWDMDAVKGVGWGLKTLGRTYPALLSDWLLAQRGRRHRQLMLRKAVTYLPDDQSQQIVEDYGQ